jgi:hypothetical protein
MTPNPDPRMVGVGAGTAPIGPHPPATGGESLTPGDEPGEATPRGLPGDPGGKDEGGYCGGYPPDLVVRDAPDQSPGMG